jgi:apolipoprotein N-acyltransferase
MKRVIWLSALSGILYAAAQPPCDIGLLAFVALVPLLVAASTRSVGMRLLAGAVAGTVAGVGCVGTSVYQAARLYFDQPPWAGALFAVAVPLVYGAPYFAAFALAAGRSCRDTTRVLGPSIVVPAAWVATEYARATLGHGTPWCMLAHSQMGAPALLQTASLGGTFAVSFAIALVNAAAFALLRSFRGALPARVALGRVIAAAVLVLAVLLHGRRELDRWSHPSGPVLRVAIVQPNLPPEWRGEIARIPETLERLVGLTRRASTRSPDLVVWPENAVGFVVEANDLPLRAAVDALPDGSFLLLGAPRSALDGDGHASFRNAAFLVDRSGHVLARQDKRRLTPFAEAWPTGLPRPSGQRDPYRPGDEVALLDAGGIEIGVLICSEAIYPDLARDLVRAGARLLVNISNDAWFGTSPAPIHHLNAARLRAVELRRFLARSTNTGLSAVVAPSGEIVAAIPPGEPGAAVAEVVPLGETTPYARFGDWFAWLCLLATAIGNADVAAGFRLGSSAPSRGA